MYVNLGQPLPIPPSTYIIIDDYGDAAGSWTLYVPKGSKSAYQDANGWKSFKSIIEDSSLTSGNGTPQGGGGGGQSDSHSGTHNGHEYVDLGLSVKWATCNVGATKPEEYGGYYAWGETEEKDVYNWGNYKHCDGTRNSCHDIGNNIANTKYDVAHVKWGGSWRMPTKAQQDEFRKKCTKEWTQLNGVNGMLFTGPNGNTIFLPAAGQFLLDKLRYEGEICYYWSSTFYPAETTDCWSYILQCKWDEVDWFMEDRDRGNSVRPVCP